MILALGRAKAPSDRLDEENPALGRTRENDAAHVQIDAGRQHPDVADDARFTRSKAIEDRLPVFAGGRSIHVLRGDARLHEPLCDVLRVAAVDAESKGRTPFAELNPGVDDVAGHDGAVHRIGKLVFVEISGDGLDPGEVGLARRKGFESREKAVANQIGSGRSSDQVVVVFAETAGPRRSRQAEERNVGTVPHPSEYFAMELMRLVDEDQIDFGSLPTSDRLN